LLKGVYEVTLNHFDVLQLQNVLMRIWIQLLTLMQFRNLLLTANPEFGFQGTDADPLDPDPQFCVSGRAQLTLLQFAFQGASS
jgi:hypothetical protein